MAIFEELWEKRDVEKGQGQRLHNGKNTVKLFQYEKKRWKKRFYLIPVRPENKPRRKGEEAVEV